ncbi:hypothetical protein ACFWVC_16250 [Streptomyces sp. NPDC058691]|uniref:hypothetical protein n=1 Tax=Streptomyces sp. NPDC058691 TaxID=3346601 RepID=UPI00365D68AC
MRKAFAHEAVVVLAPGGDERAPGGAITVALCGGWEHEGRCPLAAHHTAVSPGEDKGVRLRVLFAAEPADEPEVRARIEAALAAGTLGREPAPDTRWELRASGPSPVRADEAGHAARLSG